MKPSTLALLAALGATTALCGCADEYAYGPPAPYADVGYTGYYDDYYGPFYGGYWGPNGYFFYSDRDGRHFHRDAGHHFRPRGGAGFHPIQGHAPPAGHGRGGGHAH